MIWSNGSIPGPRNWSGMRAPGYAMLGGGMRRPVPVEATLSPGVLG